MRTLKLTTEQVELIQHALGIAELKYTEKQVEVINLKHARNNPDGEILQTAADAFFKLATKFADLNTDIKFNHLDA